MFWLFTFFLGGERHMRYFVKKNNNTKKNLTTKPDMKGESSDTGLLMMVSSEFI